MSEPTTKPSLPPIGATSAESFAGLESQFVAFPSLSAAPAATTWSPSTLHGLEAELDFVALAAMPVEGEASDVAPSIRAQSIIDGLPSVWSLTPRPVGSWDVDDSVAGRPTVSDAPSLSLSIGITAAVEPTLFLVNDPQTQHSPTGDLYLDRMTIEAVADAERCSPSTAIEPREISAIDRDEGLDPELRDERVLTGKQADDAPARMGEAAGPTPTGTIESVDHGSDKPGSAAAADVSTTIALPLEREPEATTISVATPSSRTDPTQLEAPVLQEPEPKPPLGSTFAADVLPLAPDVPPSQSHEPSDKAHGPVRDGRAPAEDGDAITNPTVPSASSDLADEGANERFSGSDEAGSEENDHQAADPVAAPMTPAPVLDGEEQVAGAPETISTADDEDIGSVTETMDSETGDAEPVSSRSAESGDEPEATPEAPVNAAVTANAFESSTGSHVENVTPTVDKAFDTDPSASAGFAAAPGSPWIDTDATPNNSSAPSPKASSDGVTYPAAGPGPDPELAAELLDLLAPIDRIDLSDLEAMFGAAEAPNVSPDDTAPEPVATAEFDPVAEGDIVAEASGSADAPVGDDLDHGEFG